MISYVRSFVPTDCPSEYFQYCTVLEIWDMHYSAQNITYVHVLVLACAMHVCTCTYIHVFIHVTMYVLACNTSNSCTTFQQGTWEIDRLIVHEGGARGVYLICQFPMYPAERWYNSLVSQQLLE